MMDSNKNDSNNLFMWATKELSQDAIVAWLLSMKDIGECFLKSLVKVLNKCALPNEFEISNIRTQHEKIDVLVDIKYTDEKTGNEVTDAIIIEDKTDTFLHDYQMLKYIEKISKKKVYNNIYYVLFKSGNIYSWDEEEYKKFQKKINNDKTYKYTVVDLYEECKFNGLPIRDLYTGKDINFENKPKDSVIVCDIFSKDKFIEFYNKNEKSIADEWDKMTFKKIISSFKNNDSKEEEYYVSYETIKKYFENKGEYRTIMTVPGGSGKRPYEFCIYHSDLFSIDPKKIKDNYLILPYIKWTSKKIEFKINYYFIADLTKANGYMPFKKLIEKYKNDGLSEFKDNLFEKYIRYGDNIRKAGNALLLDSFSIQINSSESEIKTSLDTLLEYSKNAVSTIQEL